MDYMTTATTFTALAIAVTAIKRLIYSDPELEYDSDSDLEFEYVSSGPLSDKILEDLEWLNQNHPNWREPPLSSIKFN